MSFKIVIQEVTVTEVRNGRNKYDQAEVVYTFNGQNRTQKIMSFSNPAVFAKVKAMKAGETYVVEVTKNDKGFNQWASVEKASEGESEQKPETVGKGFIVSEKKNNSWETAEERAKKQVLIVKQSCLAQAVAFQTQATGASVEDVLETAQTFVDWIMADDSQALGREVEDFPKE